MYLLMNSSSGIVSGIVILEGFEYNGAITDSLVSEVNNVSMLLLLSVTDNSSEWFCFEDYCNDKNMNSSHSLLGFSTNSGWSEIESTVGSLIASYGIGVLIPLICGPITLPFILATFAIGIGVVAIADSNGFFSGHITEEDKNNLVVDMVMLPLGGGVSKGLSILGKTAIKQITKKEVITLSSIEATTKVKGFINTIYTISNECINYARDKIIEIPVRTFIEEIRGTIYGV